MDVLRQRSPTGLEAARLNGTFSPLMHRISDVSLVAGGTVSGTAWVSEHLQWLLEYTNVMALAGLLVAVLGLAIKVWDIRSRNHHADRYRRLEWEKMERDKADREDRKQAVRDDRFSNRRGK